MESVFKNGKSEGVEGYEGRGRKGLEGRRRRDVVDGARRVRSEKLKKHQYREGYARTVERKRLE